MTFVKKSLSMGAVVLILILSLASCGQTRMTMGNGGGYEGAKINDPDGDTGDGSPIGTGGFNPIAEYKSSSGNCADGRARYQARLDRSLIYAVSSRLNCESIAVPIPVAVSSERPVPQKIFVNQVELINVDDDGDDD